MLGRRAVAEEARCLGFGDDRLDGLRKSRPAREGKGASGNEAAAAQSEDHAVIIN